MKKLLKFACVVCFVSLCIFLTTLFAQAATPTVSFSYTAAGKGQNITVTVIISDCPKVKSLGVRPIYDAEKLEYIDGEWLIGDALLSDWSHTDQTGVAAYSSEKDLNGNIAKFIFRIKDSSSWDDIPFSCDVVLKNADGNVDLHTTATSIPIVCYHIWDTEELTKYSTCTQNGYTYFACTICGGENRQTEFDRLPHTPSDWIVDKEVSKHENGERHKKCTACNTILETETIPQIPTIPTPLIIAGIAVGTAVLITITVIIIVKVKRRRKR